MAPEIDYERPAVADPDLFEGDPGPQHNCGRLLGSIAAARQNNFGNLFSQDGQHNQKRFSNKIYGSPQGFKLT